MPTKRHRKEATYINIRLSVKSDADLIDWWQHQPPGIGGETVRKAIRDRIASASGNSTATQYDVQEGAQAILNAMAEQYNELQAQLNAMRQQMADMQRQLKTGVMIAGNGQQADVNPEQPQLSREEADQALKKVLNNRW